MNEKITLHASSSTSS